jgi:ATP-dependent protease ClpP protease subunit
MTARPWYRIRAGATTAELMIFDVIDEAAGVGALQFVRDLDALPSSVRTIRLRINSPGGDPFAAVTIANALRQHKATVNVEIEGLAASAATLPAVAGNHVTIASNALFMIHDPIAWTIGDAADHRAMVECLDRVTESIVATYRWRSTLPASELRALMTATTWMSAEETVAKGFADAVSSAVPVEARHRSEAFALLGVPERFKVAASALCAGPLPAPRRGTARPRLSPADIYAARNGGAR